MWAAWAAETTGHGSEPFYATAEFWVGVAFVIFIALVGKTVFRIVAVALDERSQRIKTHIEESERLAREAQALLAEHQRKQREATVEAQAIVENAIKESERYRRQAAIDAKNSLDRRQQAAIERIGQAEVEALADIRARAVDLAIEAVRRILADRLSAERADTLIYSAIKDLPKHLH